MGSRWWVAGGGLQVVSSRGRAAGVSGEYNIYTYGRFTNNGMLPASIFDILARSTLTAHVRRGADNPFPTRQYRKYFAEEHTFSQAWTTMLYRFYRSSDYQGGAVIFP